jgi:UDP-N-acetylglucosamine 3-dehydrogenase
MLRGALIGLGKIAQMGHLPAYADPLLRSRARIVAAVEVEEPCKEKAHSFWPEISVYRTFAELQKSEEIDFIDVCTPPCFHREAIETALKHNLHILCEKPLSGSVKQAREAAYMLKKHDELVFMLCHQYRYSLIWRRFKEFMDTDLQANRCLVQFNVFRTQADQGYYQRNPGWRTDCSLSGGGILADTGFHYIDLALWMLGEPGKVTASVFNLKYQDLQVEDTAFVTLEFEKGVVNLALTWASNRRANSAWLVCPQACLVYDGKILEKSSGQEKETYQVPDASDKIHYVSLKM